MPGTQVPFLTKLANVVFAQRIANAQEQLWQLCAYGQPTKTPGEAPLDKRIRQQLERGAKLDVVNKDGDTPLIILCRRALTLEAKCLIAVGTDIRPVNNKGENAFLAAAAAGDGGLVKELLNRGADAKATNGEGRNALYLMVHAQSDRKDSVERSRQADGLSLLLKSGLVLDDHLKMALYNHKPHLLQAVPDMNAVYALTTSADQGNAEHVKLLLDMGIRPDAPAQFSDNTPLCVSAAAGHLDVMKTLLDAGADINLPSPKTHRTPLQTAVRRGQREAFALLLDKGASITTGMGLLELARDCGTQGMASTVYDAMIERGIMKTEVALGKAAMKTIKLKTPAAGAG